MSEKKIESVPIPKKSDSLSGFISAIGNNTGASLSSPKSKDKYNPFSAENQKQVNELYNVMKSYKEKTSSKDILVPSSVEVLKNKKVEFKFDSEIKTKVFDEIVDIHKYDNITLDQSSKVIEINKK